MTKDYRTADAIERELTLAGVLHDKARWWIPGTSREGPMPCARDTGALCRYYSTEDLPARRPVSIFARRRY